MSEMILARPSLKEAALQRILPMQRQDFVELFKIMAHRRWQFASRSAIA